MRRSSHVTPAVGSSRNQKLPGSVRTTSCWGERSAVGGMWALSLIQIAQIFFRGIAGHFGRWSFGWSALWIGLLVAASGKALAADGDGTMRPISDIFEPLSRPAEMIHQSAVLVILITSGIFVVVTAMLVYVVWKFRHRGTEDKLQEPPQIYGSSHIELAWTVIPILITFVLILVTSRTIGEVQNAPIPKNAIQIRLIGHQWWWEVQYPGEDFTTANEIHVPVSTRAVGGRHPQLLGAAIDWKNRSHPQPREQDVDRAVCHRHVFWELCGVLRSPAREHAPARDRA